VHRVSAFHAFCYSRDKASWLRNKKCPGMGDVKQSDFVAAVLMEEYETWNSGDFSSSCPSSRQIYLAQAVTNC
jgi:hypothetical protein